MSIRSTFGIDEVLKSFGIGPSNYGAASGVGERCLPTKGEIITPVSPVDGQPIAQVYGAEKTDLDAVVQKAEAAFLIWRSVPAPKRGDIVRQLGDEFRKHKQSLGKLVSYEMGKSYQEGLGEVQEVIDICDYAVGLSRQLYGMTTHSERSRHRLYEQYHPLGVVGIISAFNFPVAVWAWNSMIAWVCGDTCVWKPSEKTPLTALAALRICAEVFKKNSVPDGICSVVIGGRGVGEAIAAHPAIALVSATGSVRMGREVGKIVAARLGRVLLELGGNNAIIVSESADLNLMLRGTVFGAVGTAGQRCTTTRRLIVHESVYDKVRDALAKAYAQLRIGNPLDQNNHVGPLIDRQAVEAYKRALASIKKEGGSFLVEGGVLEGAGYESGCYVRPCIAEVKESSEIAREETFAPILYMYRYRELVQAIQIQNSVPQGLSSSIFTSSLRESEIFLSCDGSDCGIANVNIGTSGAEIGGAFGGEKETGGGRESGSDSWKAYMRRQTNTINFGSEIPLAQGVKFDI